MLLDKEGNAIYEHWTERLPEPIQDLLGVFDALELVREAKFVKGYKRGADMKAYLDAPSRAVKVSTSPNDVYTHVVYENGKEVYIERNGDRTTGRPLSDKEVESRGVRLFPGTIAMDVRYERKGKKPVEETKYFKKSDRIRPNR